MTDDRELQDDWFDRSMITINEIRVLVADTPTDWLEASRVIDRIKQVISEREDY